MEEVKDKTELLKPIDIKEAIRQLVIVLLIIFSLMILLYFPAKYFNFSCYVAPLSHITALSITILMLRRYRIKEFGRKFKSIDLTIYPLVILISGSLLIILFPILQLLPMLDNLSGFSSAEDANIVLLLIYGVVLVPVLEELFFRGIILEDFLKMYPVKKAIIYSSIIFAVIHLNPTQTLSAFLGGLILGWLYFKTKSLLPCILLHTVNNSTSGVLFQYCSPGSKFFKENDLLYYLLYFFSLVILFSSIYLIKQIAEKTNAGILQDV